MSQLRFSIVSSPSKSDDVSGVAVFFNGCIDDVPARVLRPFAGALALLMRDLNRKKSRDCVAMPVNADEVGFSHVALFNMVPDEGAKPDPLSAFEQVKVVAADALKFAAGKKAQRVVFFLGKHQAGLVAALVAEGAVLGHYRFDKYKSKKSDGGDDDVAKDDTKILSVELVVDKSEMAGAQAQVPESILVTEAANTARDVINEPGSVMNPEAFVEVVRREAAAAGVECEVLDPDQLHDGGYGGLCGVGRGAMTGPYMAVLRYQPKFASAKKQKKDAVHLALVGKGITFDTGGICIKPGKGMGDMKNDMSGAAIVLSAVCAIAKLGLPVRVTAVIPIAENAVDAMSYLPGDILRMKSGKTVHVDNTDAEGRLILADALWQAGHEGATHIVDIATLTGAIAIALGSSVAGLFSNDDEFGAMMLEAGDAVGEDMWQLPLWQEYREGLQHHVADLNNVGKSRAGSITAALFLQEFVPDGAKWAHLDIAGVDMVDGRWRYYDKGATAFGVRTFVALAEMLSDNT